MGDHVVAPDQQPVRLDLAWQMTVAEVPGQPRKVVRVAASDFEQVLLGGADLDLSSILQRQTVAIGQHGRVGQIDEHGQPAVGGQDRPAQVAGGVVERQGVGGDAIRANKGAGSHGLAHAAPRFIAAASAGRLRNRSK